MQEQTWEYIQTCLLFFEKLLANTHGEGGGGWRREKEEKEKEEEEEEKEESEESESAHKGKLSIFC